MLLYSLSHKFIRIVTLAGALVTLAGCSYIYDDLPECPAQLRLRFVYDYNMKFSDAFAHEVGSVNVWAFDSKGALVWSGSETGAALKQENYVMETPLTDGTYDFVAWCGLEGNDGFSLDTYIPKSREDLEVRLKTVADNEGNISDSRLKGIYNGFVEHVEYKVDPQKPSIKTVTVPLKKMTNNITVMLQNYDGTPIKENDFSAEITYADTWLEWNGNVTSTSPMVTYRPWRQFLGEATINESQRTITSISAMLFGLTTSRLMAQGGAQLTIIRRADNAEIIKIPLVDCLLMEKEINYEELSDQEYLDRRDDYSVLFILDGNINLYMKFRLFINGWAVVPPQTGSF